MIIWGSKQPVNPNQLKGTINFNFGGKFTKQWTDVAQQLPCQQQVCLQGVLASVLPRHGSTWHQPSRGEKLYKSLYEKLGKAVHEKQPEKGLKL